MNKNPKNMRVSEGWDAELWLSIAPEVRDKLAAQVREKGDSGLRSRQATPARISPPKFYPPDFCRVIFFSQFPAAMIPPKTSKTF